MTECAGFFIFDIYSRRKRTKPAPVKYLSYPMLLGFIILENALLLNKLRAGSGLVQQLLLR